MPLGVVMGAPGPMRIGSAMARVQFRCPTIGVEVEVTGHQKPEVVFKGLERFRCLACGQSHFVLPERSSSGELIADGLQLGAGEVR